LEKHTSDNYLHTWKSEDLATFRGREYLILSVIIGFSENLEIIENQY